MTYEIGCVEHTRRPAWLGAALLTFLCLLAGAFGITLGLAPSGPSSPAWAQRGLEALPLAARGAVERSLGAADRRLAALPVANGFAFTNRAAGVTASLSREDVVVSGGGLSWSMGLRAYGYGRHLASVRATAPTASGNRVLYLHPDVQEWYANGPLGLEQGFSLDRPPLGSRSGPLTLAIGRLPTAVRARVLPGGRGVQLTNGGRDLLRYGGLFASDARGRALPARVEVSGRSLLLRVDDRGAQYPVRVDPFVQAAKLTASDGAANDDLGTEVAISGDGSTIVAISGNGDAYVFVRPAGGWASATQTAKLSPADGNPLSASIAVSSDGSTIVAGSPQAQIGSNAGQGAAYVFLRPSGGWGSATPAQAQLAASDGQAFANLGDSVAISGDGSTVTAGAPEQSSSEGEAYVFVKPGGGWGSGTQPQNEAARLTASDGASDAAFGSSVSASNNGSTVAVGAFQAKIGSNVYQGAVYVFVKPGGGWGSGTQPQNEAVKLTASDGAQDDELGSSVALSGDSSTVAAGANGATIGANTGQGAVYVFLEPGGGWGSGGMAQSQSAKLAASDGADGDHLGYSVGISSDGSTVAAGAPDAAVGANEDQGAAYVFVKPGDGWGSGAQPQHEAAKLTASDGASFDGFGFSVGISGDGSTVAAGAPFATVNANSDQGALYAFIASSSTAVSCQPTSATAGHSTTCTATVADTGAGRAAPTGRVSFSSNSAGTFGSGGSCALAPTAAAGVASCQLTYTPSSVASGTHTITASYGGDAGHEPSKGTTALGVVPVSAGPALSCSLKPTTAHVSATTLAQSAKKHRAPKGVLKLTVNCNQSGELAASGKITAVLKAVSGKKHKHKRKTFLIKLVHQAITAGKSSTLTVKVPKGALAALKSGARESVVFTITVATASGPSTTTSSIKRLKLSKTKHK